VSGLLFLRKAGAEGRKELEKEYTMNGRRCEGESQFYDIFWGNDKL
jgi:hypothetical protein